MPTIYARIYLISLSLVLLDNEIEKTRVTTSFDDINPLNLIT